MNICFICDLHLPKDKRALQYDSLEFAIQDITERSPDIIAFAGDVTSDGDVSVYREFIERMKKIGIPFLYIPGNSDLRSYEYADEISAIASPTVNFFDKLTVVAINDCRGSFDDFSFLKDLEDGSVIFMHHPPFVLTKTQRAEIDSYLSSHGRSRFFYAHQHLSKREGQYVSLGALDPDKEIGECPCITYYDTDTDELFRSYYSCHIPEDIYDYFGISCYRVSDIELAIREKLRYIELRPSILSCPEDTLISLISRWRRVGGVGLSLHLPEVTYSDSEARYLGNPEKFAHFIELLGVDRVTQHVPKISVESATDDVLCAIADCVASLVNSVKRGLTLGVENMHMTKDEKADATRRFGYIPSECLAFMELLRVRVRGKVGINFDIGHARNNEPFSQTYQISGWYAALGEECIGYHIHQVAVTDSKFVNHTAITEPYGRLISYASTFKCWSTGRIAKAPFIFEMDDEGAYDTTLATFRRERAKE